MTDILQHSPPQPHHPSSPSSTRNDDLRSRAFLDRSSFISPVALCSGDQDQDNLSVLAAFLAAFRKSLVGCRDASGETCAVDEQQFMEIGWPTDVRHVAHVTFDRFNGFLGLPVEFEPEVPRRPPSASTTVFGVSTESMQLSHDSRGNCVPTILLMMQSRLYSQGGLQSEGIFRINPENGQEEYVREQLNNGLIPDNIDVHCLAGLIKAWFRELPTGILDSLPPEQVMEVQTEDECAKLVRLLPTTESALLDWAINLMADVAQFESSNKMSARNIAMVFAPNMTQMSDPLTALMYAVQVMNFLKTLIVRTLRERDDHLVEAGPGLHLEPSDEEDNRQGISKPTNLGESKASEEEEQDVTQNQTISSTSHAGLRTGNHTLGPANENGNNPDTSNPASATNNKDGPDSAAIIRRNQARSRRTKPSQPRNPNDVKKELRKLRTETVEKKELNIISRVNLRTERVETWR